MVCALDYHGRKLRTRFSLLELANCIAHICNETKAKIRTFALLLHFPLICTSQHVLDPNTLGCAGECSTMALLLKWQYYPPLPKKKPKKKTKTKNKQTSMVSTPLQQDKKKTKNSNEKGAWTKDQFNFHLVWLLRSQASLTSVSQTSTLTQLKVFSFSGQPGLISGRLDT